MLTPHSWIVQDEVGQPNFHLRIKGLASSFFFLEFLGVVPSCDVFGVDFELPGLFPDDFGKVGVVPSNFLSDGGDQFFFELDRVTSIGYRSFSFGWFCSFTFELISLLFSVELISFLHDLDINSI